MLEAPAPDWIHDAVELVVFLGGVGATIWKMGSAITRFEIIGTQQAKEIGELKETVKEVSKVIVQQALQTQGMDLIREQVGRQERLIDDLRRGEGFVLPINPRLVRQE